MASFSSSAAAAAAAADGEGGRGPTDADQWRVRQVYGDGKVLLDQLREVAELLADGFNASGRTSKDLLNGLVQKVCFACVCCGRQQSYPGVSLSLVNHTTPHHTTEGTHPSHPSCVCVLIALSSPGLL